MKPAQIAARVLKIGVPLVTGLAFLAGLVFVILWMSGVFTEKIEAGPVDVARRKATPDELARVYEVEERVKPYIEEAVGTLRAASRTEVSARVMAPIEEVTVRAGSVVRRGDVLVRLDRRDLETQLSQVQASLVAAQAALSNAQNDYARTREAYEKSVRTRESLDEAIEAYRVAQAKLNHAEQALAEARVKLSYTTIAAPKDGVVVDRLAEEGDMAQPGVPLLVLYDPTSLRLEVPVMENLAVNLHVGDERDVKIDALGKTVKATVDEKVPQAEAASRSFLVKARVPRSEGMYEGMFGRLMIPAGRRAHLCVHTGAIETVGQIEFVDVVLPDDTIERRLIKTGRLGYPGHIEVLSGLKARERVVLKRPATDAGAPPPDAPGKEASAGNDL